MQKVLLTLFLAIFLVFHSHFAFAEEPTMASVQEIKMDSLLKNEPSYLEQLMQNEEIEITAVDLIEIGVKTHEIRLTQNTDKGFLSKKFPAATASPKNSVGLPYDKVGTIWKIVFNPSWAPPESIHAENFEKFGKRLPKIVPPGKGNPLGIVKFFISYKGYNSSLGIHNTDEPSSIGKNVSHGCNRLTKEDSLELASLILGQNGYDAEEIISKAISNPKKAISIPIANGPNVIYRR